VNSDELADPAGGGRARVRCGLYGCDVAAHDRRDQARIYLLPPHEHDVSGLHHGVRRFNHADKAAGLHEAERFTWEFPRHEAPILLRDAAARGNLQAIDDFSLVDEPYAVHEVRYDTGVIRRDPHQVAGLQRRIATRHADRRVFF
jgi:hypothetical protein